MASRRRRKRNKLSRTVWAFIWTICLLTILIIGAYTSELTHLRVVRIEASELSDRDRVASIINAYADIPEAQIDAREVEKKLEQIRQVEFSRFYANVFGFARVEVQYRKPIATLAGREPLCVDRSGEIFPSKAAANLRISIAAQDKDLAPILCIADPTAIRELAMVAGKVQDFAPGRYIQVSCDQMGRLCFNIGGQTTVVLGTAASLDRKVEAAKNAFQTDPSLWQKAKILNVVDPDNVVYE
jgi:hypothetical protein